MKTRIYLFLIAVLAYGCNAQNSVTTNKIISTKDNLLGVESKEGRLLIDSIYKHIRIVFDHEKLILPAKEYREGLNQPEYYLVSNLGDQKALFDKDGGLVFGFIDCIGIIIDQHTQTVVVTKKTQVNARPESYLYSLNGALLFDTSYENIAFISNSDLIALIADDGPNEEFYLYNPFEENKLGPFDHFNIYNEDFTTPEGMTESNYVKSLVLR